MLLVCLFFLEAALAITFDIEKSVEVAEFFQLIVNVWFEIAAVVVVVVAIWVVVCKVLPPVIVGVVVVDWKSYVTGLEALSLWYELDPLIVMLN